MDSGLSIEAGAAWAGETAKSELADLQALATRELERNTALQGALHEAKARLMDIAAGADIMLEPIMGVDKLPNWVGAYIREVKRVASAPL